MTEPNKMIRTRKTTAPSNAPKTIPTVPEAEWPYQVPENWRYCRLKDLSIRIKRGKTPKYVQSSEIPVFAQKCNQKDGTISIEKAQFLDPVKASELPDDEFLQDKDIIINSTGTGTLGRVGLYRNEFVFPYKKILPDSHITVVRTIELVNKCYLYYFLHSKQEYLEQQGVGSTNQKELKPDSISAIPIPLPPLAEQQRIVDRIERLFAKLDEAREKAQAVVNSFENRKAAILHQAFTGELTRKWREERGIGISSWTPKTSTELFKYVTSGSRGWAQYYSDHGQVFIRMSNLDHGTIELDLTDIQYVNLPDKAEGQRSLIQQGDILISITADVGMIGLVKNIDFEAYINQHIALARPVEIESSEFIAWCLVSDVGFSQFRNKQRGATKIGLGLNDIRTLILKMPCIEERKEILKLISNCISKERRARDLAESVIAQIDGMKKAILARAFRGELGTNVPGELACECISNNNH